MKRLVAVLLTAFCLSSITLADEAGFGLLVVNAKEYSRVWGTRGPLRTGATVLDVLEGSPAEAVDIQMGDVISRIDGTSVSDAADYTRLSDKLEVGKPVTVHIRRVVGRKVETMQRKMSPVSDADLDKLVKAACPIRAAVYSVEDNRIGIPEVKVIIKNRSTIAVVAAEFNFECYNGFGDPVGFENGIFQEKIPPLGFDRGTWQLPLEDTTKTVKGTILRVKTEDGREWKGKSPVFVPGM